MATYDELAGRLVLITGGANGIGQAMVEAFHALGAVVCFCDLDDRAGVRLAKRQISSSDRLGSLEITNQ